MVRTLRGCSLETCAEACQIGRHALFVYDG